MPTPDSVTLLLYAAGAIALLVVVWRGATAVAEARVRRARGDRPLGEERLKAYAALVEAGVPPAAAGVPPAPPALTRAAASPGIAPPDPHLLARVTLLEAKVAALEAQIGAPAAAELFQMRAPRPETGSPQTPRPSGLRAFP